MSDIRVYPKLITHLSKSEVGEDIHIVKEYKTDNTHSIRIIKDFQRPVWITIPEFRTHKDKKESEELSKLSMFTTTQSDMYKKIAIALGMTTIDKNVNVRAIKNSPYVYGIDIDSRTFLKHLYIKKYNLESVVYSVGALDIETDLENNQIVVITLATHSKVYTRVNGRYLRNIESPIKSIYSTIESSIPENSINPIYDVKILNNEIDLIKDILKIANESDVDIIGIWNINYDIPYILDKLKQYGIDPKDVFHYDKIPAKYKYFKFNEGSRQKVTESGKIIPKSPEDIWSTVKATTNYYLIDAMAAYKYIRVGSKNIPGGYSLNNVLEKEKIAKKLRFDTDSSIKGIEWHLYMIKNRIVEYIVYNIWDTLSMLELDKKTRDLSVSLSALSGISHFDIFNSGPKKILDSMMFFYLKHKRVLGTRPDIDGEDDDKLLGLDNWIVTMQPHKIDKINIDYITNDDILQSGIKKYVFDADAISSYPNNIKSANVSKDTTHREISNVVGYPTDELKIRNIDLIFGKTNAIEYCIDVFNLPDMSTLLEMIRQQNDH